jgi:putative endonuclease
MQGKKEKGKDFEELAKNYLIKKGFVFIESNYKSKCGEIDLIMKDKNTLVFIEVKGRKKTGFFDIRKSVGRKKIKRILKTAEIYIAERNLDFDEVRVDTLFLEQTGHNTKISHFINWI